MFLSLIGEDENGTPYKGIVVFMIVGLKKIVPFVVKAVPETKINGTWLSTEIDSALDCIHQCGFQVKLHNQINKLLHNLIAPLP